LTVIELGPHANLTPEQALAVCTREEWTNVIIIGFQPNSDTIVVRSSVMTREFANWIIDHAKVWALDL